MRPFRSFLLILILLACLIGLNYFIPDNIKLPQVNEFVPWDLIKGTFTRISIDTSAYFIQAPDTLSQKSDYNLSTKDTVPSREEKKPSGTLKDYLDTLNYRDGQIRIMYYGDSQIEGDRITSYLRQSLREDYGGSGPGLFLPVIPVMYTKSVYIRSSSNWERYNYLSFRAGEISHRNLGPFMTICRYMPEGEISSAPVKASVRIVPSTFADYTTSLFDKLRIFYGNSRDIVKVTVRADDYPVLSDTLIRGNGLFELTCSLYKATNITIEFEGRVSPDIYGISIEGDTGLVVDNLPQRGSAGLEFTMVEKDKLKKFYDRISPDLFILHYGLNLVKSVRKEYSYYEKGLYRQIALLREISPGTPVVVVGLTDMAFHDGDSIRSYPNIPSIIEAQKKAALAAGAIFWDSFRAMGGDSSIIKWVERDPPLAQKDYTHFTYPGADTIAKYLVSGLFRGSYADSLLKTDSVVTVETDLSAAIHIQEQSETAEESALIANLVSRIFSYDPDKPFIFSTPAFWIFFLLVLVGYSVVYKKLVLRNLYLFLISLFFYFKSGGLFLFLLIIVTSIDYCCGLLIYRSSTRSLRRLFVLVSIISNIGLLAYFKYTGFFVDTLNNLLGTDIRVYDYLASFSNKHLGTSFNVSHIILPVGISFFTFQSLSYTMDMYRRKLEPVRNILDFGFYVSFFPQLVAGPIVRASEFIPQLYAEFHLARREFSHALFLISKGLIKKIIISDFIAVNFIDRVFELPTMYSGFENLMAVYGYGLQIYCDFSGYTDIAIGLGLILGFRLPVNFNSPYKASGVADFWKRWHISLSRWLKDYLYISLGGNRKGRFRTFINLMITMLLGGLWHGAALRFIVWGGLHGVGLIFNKIWRYLLGDRLIRKKAGRALAVFITFQFVSFCWIFFRASDMDTAILMLRQIFENFSPGSYQSLIMVYSTVFSLIAAGYLIHFLPERIKESYRGLFIRIPVVVQMAVILLMAILIYQMKTTDIMPFIYFRF